MSTVRKMSVELRLLARRVDALQERIEALEARRPGRPKKEANGAEAHEGSAQEA